jgi:hypothetical protein
MTLLMVKNLKYFFDFVVTNFDEATAEYNKKVNLLNTTGWDQEKFQKIVAWYGEQKKKFTSPTVPTKVEIAPKESFFTKKAIFSLFC